MLARFNSYRLLKRVKTHLSAKLSAREITALRLSRNAYVRSEQFLT